MILIHWQTIQILACWESRIWSCYLTWDKLVMQCFILVVYREISHQFLYKQEPIDEYVYSEKSMQVTTRIYPVVISTKLTPKGVTCYETNIYSCFRPKIGAVDVQLEAQPTSPTAKWRSLIMTKCVHQAVPDIYYLNQWWEQQNEVLKR